MIGFSRIEDGVVILRSRGRYYQRDIYSRDLIIYAKHGSCWLMLYKTKNTSAPGICWEAIETVKYEPKRCDRLGRLTVKS